MMNGPSGAPGAGITGQETPRCAWHAQSHATALCVSCARPVCRQCDRIYAGRHYCFQCAPAQTPVYILPLAVPMPPNEPPEPEDEREKRWWRADWKLGEVFAALAVIFIPYNILGALLYYTRKELLFVSYIAYAALFCPLTAATVWFVLRRHRRGRKELGLQWAEPRRTLLAGGLGSISALALSYGAYGLVLLIFYIVAGRLPSSGSEEISGMGTGFLVLMFLCVVVLAPIFEEMFFRGLMYPALRRKLGARMAVFLNGLIFGALHFEPLFLISLVLVGMVLAYEYEKTDSLFAPMLTHSLYNLAVMVIFLVLGW